MMSSWPMDMDGIPQPQRYYFGSVKETYSLTDQEKGKKNDKYERFTVLQTSSSIISGYISRSSTDHGGFEFSHCKLWEKRKNRNIHPPAAPGDQFKIFKHVFDISEANLSKMAGLIDLNFCL